MKPATRPPKAPAGLSAGSRAMWDRFVSQYAPWGPVELEHLSAALVARDHADALAARIGREGLIVQGKRGVRVNPLVRAERAARGFSLACLRQIGLQEGDE